MKKAVLQYCNTATATATPKTDPRRFSGRTGPSAASRRGFELSALQSDVLSSAVANFGGGNHAAGSRRHRSSPEGAIDTLQHAALGHRW